MAAAESIMMAIAQRLVTHAEKRESRMRYATFNKTDIMNRLLPNLDGCSASCFNDVSCTRALTLIINNIWANKIQSVSVDVYEIVTDL